MPSVDTYSHAMSVCESVCLAAEITYVGRGRSICKTTSCLCSFVQPVQLNMDRGGLPMNKEGLGTEEAERAPNTGTHRGRRALKHYCSGPCHAHNIRKCLVTEPRKARDGSHGTSTRLQTVPPPFV